MIQVHAIREPELDRWSFAGTCMSRPFQIAALATLLVTISLYLWRISFTYSDWAILALTPMAVIIATSFWSLTLDPWKARLDIALREESSWKKWLTGRIRATLLTAVFTLGVTSRQVVWLFLEQLRPQFVPILHRLQGRLAAQG